MHIVKKKMVYYQTYPYGHLIFTMFILFKYVRHILQLSLPLDHPSVLHNLASSQLAFQCCTWLTPQGLSLTDPV